MGDTGSLVLGFVVAVLCVRLIQVNPQESQLIKHSPVFVLSVVLIPVFDTVRVFLIRLWRGTSPFTPDKNHIHHLLTNNGWSHSFTSKMICAAHALVLVLGYFLKDIPLLAGLGILIAFMLLVVYIFQRLRIPEPVKSLTMDSQSIQG